MRGLTGVPAQEAEHRGVELVGPLQVRRVRRGREHGELRSLDQVGDLALLPGGNEDVVLGRDDVDGHRQPAEAVARLVVAGRVGLPDERLGVLRIRVVVREPLGVGDGRRVLEERLGQVEQQQRVDEVLARPAADLLRPRPRLLAPVVARARPTSRRAGACGRARARRARPPARSRRPSRCRAGGTRRCRARRRARACRPAMSAISYGAGGGGRPARRRGCRRR